MLDVHRLVKLGLGRTRHEIESLDEAWALQLVRTDEAVERGNLKWLAHFLALALAPLMGFPLVTEEEEG